jgi:hypothetical protein
MGDPAGPQPLDGARRLGLGRQVLDPRSQVHHLLRRLLSRRRSKDPQVPGPGTPGYRHLRACDRHLPTGMPRQDAHPRPPPSGDRALRVRRALRMQVKWFERRFSVRRRTGDRPVRHGWRPAALGRAGQPRCKPGRRCACRESRCSGREFHPAPLFCGERRTAEAVLLVFREHVPEENHEHSGHGHRGHVDLATGPDPLGKGMERAAGFRATTQADSTRA